MKASRTERAEVAQALAGARHSPTGWWRVDCPLCAARTGKPDRKGCMAINPGLGVFTCWKCQVSGRLPGHVGTPLDSDDRPAPSSSQIGPPDGYVPLASQEGAASMLLAPARDYAATRVAPDRWFDAQVGACAEGLYAGRVIIPVLGADPDVWLGWVGRTWYPTDRAYSYPKGMARGGVLYRGHRMHDRTMIDEPILVVEGVFDALGQCYPEAVAVLGQPSHQQIDWLAESPRPVVFVMDGDAWQAGWSYAQRLRLAGQRAGHVRLPPKADPDDVPRAWLAEEIRRAL